MGSEYVLDAHALVWFLEGNPRLGANARSALQDPASWLYLPAIALAEACWVVEHGKCAIPADADLLTDVDADPRIRLVPLDRAILDQSFALTSLADMHDRQIVATALRLTRPQSQIAVLTCDAEVTASGLVGVVW